MWNEDKRSAFLLTKAAIGETDTAGFDELGWRGLMGAIAHVSFP
jgi:hypothetical protein